MTVYFELLSMYRTTASGELHPVGEVEFANGCGGDGRIRNLCPDPVCASIVGHADLALGAPIEKVLQAMIEPGGGGFLGIRFITASHRDQAAWASSIIRSSAPQGS